MIDHTHDPDAHSWLASADAPDTDFPIQNLPLCVFRRRNSGEPFRGGIGIGDQILDLQAVADLGTTASQALAAARQPSLNALMALGQPHWSALRHALFAALQSGAAAEPVLQPALVPQADAEFTPPAVIGDFTDFYTSIHHASAVGAVLRPQNPLLENYKWLPVAYHGRSSSVGVSGQAFARPAGQWRRPGAASPAFAPSARVDYELELGFFIGPGNPAGHTVTVDQAEAHVFGACVLNDWSARDIQAWEYQPLGPFLGKNFATTISPWIVTLDALAPFRAPHARPPADPAPLPHLALGAAAARAAIDITLDVALQSQAMRDAGLAPHPLGRSNFRDAYWTLGQMVAHHTSNGCNLRPGDLLGTGTQSGPEPGACGSLLETTHGGTHPVTLPGGESRTFIADGDSIVMRAWCHRPGARRIGFGTCVGTVLPPLA